jgi:hypothetical protein
MDMSLPRRNVRVKQSTPKFEKLSTSREAPREFLGLLAKMVQVAAGGIPKK